MKAQERAQIYWKKCEVRIAGNVELGVASTTITNKTRAKSILDPRQQLCVGYFRIGIRSTRATYFAGTVRLLQTLAVLFVLLSCWPHRR